MGEIWIMLSLYILAILWTFTLAAIALANSYLREAKIIQQDLREFKSEILKLAAQRKRRF